MIYSIVSQLARHAYIATTLSIYTRLLMGLAIGDALSQSYAYSTPRAVFLRMRVSHFGIDFGQALVCIAMILSLLSWPARPFLIREALRTVSQVFSQPSQMVCAQLATRLEHRDLSVRTEVLV